MSKIKITLFFLLAILSFSACEKDDICVDGDTPLLVITFHDFENPEELKEVPSLLVGGIGNEFAVSTFTSRTDIDSIGIPLNPSVTITEFAFLINSSLNDDNLEQGNPDVVSFSYSTKEQFISRACGFIATYEELEATLTADTDNWIQDIEIVTDLVDNQNTAHVKIFH